MSDPNYSSFFADNKELDKEKIDTIIEELNNNKPVLTSEIWDLLMYFNLNKCFLLNEKGILRVLNCNEVFIRNEVAFLVFKDKLPENNEIVSAIFNDVDPSVITEAIKGVIQGYSKYNDDERTHIRKYLLDSLSNFMIITRANTFFINFGIDYGSESMDWDRMSEEEKKSIWDLWASLFPSFLDNYPKDLRVSDTGRFTATLDHSKKYVTPDQAMLICNSFYNWIDSRIKQGRHPDTHELSILSFLLTTTVQNTEGRFELFKKIFSHEDTSFITYSLSWSFHYWDKISNKEQEYILKLLSSERTDLRWLKAVALTQNFIVPEAQEIILGKKIDYNSEISEVVKLFPKQLLNDCLSVFLGHPYPLMSLGLNYGDKQIWMKIIKWILLSKHSEGFDICLREFLFDGVNGFSPRWKEDASSIWNNLCEQKDLRARLATRLINCAAQCTCSIESTKYLWHTIINAYKKDDTTELVELINSNLEALQYSHPEDIFKNFDGRFLEDHLLPKLQVDFKIMELVWKIEKGVLAKEEVNQLIQKILKISVSEHVKLKAVFDNLDGCIVSNIEKFPNLNKLRKLENKIDELGKKQREKMDDDYELEDWVTVKKN